MVQLALKTTDSSTATWVQKIASKLIKWRLATIYQHGGVVIMGKLYHMNAKGGLIGGVDFDKEKWCLFDTRVDDGADIDRFHNLGMAIEYDWRAIGDFIVPIGQDPKKYNCFETALVILGGKIGKRKVTPEVLLEFVLHGHSNGL